MGKVQEPPIGWNSLLFDTQDSYFKIMVYRYGIPHAYYNKLPFSYNILYAESEDGSYGWKKPYSIYLTWKEQLAKKNNIYQIRFGIKLRI